MTLSTGGNQYLTHSPAVHIGVGRFARGHWLPIAQQMGLEVTGIQINTPTVRDELVGQNYDYDLFELTPGMDHTRVTCLRDILVAQEDRARVVDVLADPPTRLVTLTITQQGYHQIKEHEIARELTRYPNAGYRKINEPVSAAAFLVAGLQARFFRGIDPFVVMSLDNVRDNGTELRDVVLNYARMLDGGDHGEFATWVEGVEFIGTMVDRIVPTSVGYDAEQERLLVARGLEHHPHPILTEPMPNPCLVIGNASTDPIFSHLGNVDGVFVGADVDAYSTMKIRMLNGAHIALGMVGRLAGFEFAHEAMQSPVIRLYIEEFLHQMQETLPDIPGIDKQEYAREVVERISNPLMNDPLWRLARNSFEKISQRVLDPLQEALDRGLPCEHLATAAVAWIQYLKRANNDKSFEICDETSLKRGLISLTNDEYDPCVFVNLDSTREFFPRTAGLSHGDISHASLMGMAKAASEELDLILAHAHETEVPQEWFEGATVRRSSLFDGADPSALTSGTLQLWSHEVEPRGIERVAVPSTQS
ncbi:MAG TPA: hypothetical protein PKB15_03720 [Acidimicrobiia bacterium]|nr:hypothetical protein [Acidimicrobiia bacterium]